MSGPLPLRLCCMAAMAPALTEAATQAKIKLPEGSSAGSSESSIVNGRDLRQLAHNSTVPANENISQDNSKIVKPLGPAIAVPHLNGDTSIRTSQKSATAFAKLGTIKVPANLKELFVNRSGAFPSELIKSFAHNGKLTQRMNQPSSGPINEEAEKCHKLSQNGSRTLPHGDGSNNLITDTPNARLPSDPGSSQSVCSTFTFKNMCKSGEAGGLTSSQDSTMSTSETDCAPRPFLQAATSSITHIGETALESSLSVKNDALLDKLRTEATKRQAQLERRLEFLQRRLRRVQGRQMESHLRQQLGYFVEFQHRNLQTVAKAINPSTYVNDISSSDLKAELCSDDVKNLSTAALVSLVRRLQASQTVAQISPHHSAVKSEVTNVLSMRDDVRTQSKVTAEKMAMNLTFMQSALDSDATESSSGGESCEDEEPEGIVRPSPPTPLLRRAEWKWAAERAAVASRWTWLQAQVSDLEYRIRQQSDIYKQVRLSKGPVLLGEPPPPQDLMQRLTSHLVQQSSMDNRLPSGTPTSTAVSGGMEVSPCNVSAVLSNVDKQASRLTQSLGNCLSPATGSPVSSGSSLRPKSNLSSPLPAPNGLIESPLSTSSGETDTAENSPLGQSGDLRIGLPIIDRSPVIDVTCRAARCLPLKLPLRKRKLVRTSSLHQLSRKAARLATVKCHCHPPVTQCVLCGGRANNLQPVDPDAMSFQDRVALLDSSFHQVLSFPEEVPLSVHFEALLKSGDWQSKSPARRHRSDHRRQKGLPVAAEDRKNNRQFRKNAVSVIISSAKIRSKYEHKAGRKCGVPQGKRLGKRALNAEIKRRRVAQLAALALKRRNTKGSTDSNGGNLNIYDTPSGSPMSRDALLGSCPTSAMKEPKEVRKRRGESAYDINNIVIPYSMASSTRVEKLQYKEIVTPKWRDLSLEESQSETTIKPEVPEHKSNGLISKKPPEEETEDLSDEVFIERHIVCESEEKKRFTSFVQYPTARRGRTRSEVSQSIDSCSHDLKLTLENSNQPVSMGTQASLDYGENVGDESQDVKIGRSETPVPHTLLPTFLNSGQQQEDEGILGGPGFPLRRGSMTSCQRERLSLGSSLDETQYVETQREEPWVLRTFPLTDKEVEELNVPLDDHEYIPRERPSSVAVETVSRAESSASGSQPGSPLPSSTSASGLGDFDAGDPEWLADVDIIRKSNTHLKPTKR